MNGTIKNALKLVISIGIGFGLIYFINSSLTVEDKALIFQSFRTAKLPVIVLTILLAATACVIRALRWELLLNPIGCHPRRSTLVSSIFIMYLANLIFPRLGEVLRCSVLFQKDEIPVEKSIGTMVVERLIDFLFAGLYVLLAFVFEHQKLLEIYNKYLAEKKEGSSHLLLFTIGLVILFGIVAFFVPKIRRLIIQKVKGLWEGISSIFKLEKPILFVVYSLVLYSIYFATTIIMYYAIDGLDGLRMTSGFVILTAGTLAIGLTQGGIGAFQLLVTKSLELYDIARPLGLAYSWLSWTVQTGTLVIGGIIAWVYVQFTKAR
jgi:glycosyltransferase 2 family protein